MVKKCDNCRYSVGYPKPNMSIEEAKLTVISGFSVIPIIIENDWKLHETKLICKRYPSQVMTSKDDWCGEYKKN